MLKDLVMAVEYINRRARKHYLHAGTTKTGKPKYFFSMKSEGNLVDTIPQGYEIYENPNAQVFLRKILPQVVRLEEIETVRQGVEKYAEIDYFIVDVKGNNIIIYLCDQNVDALMEIATSAHRHTSTSAKEAVLQSLTYAPIMQFVLEDEQTREFVVQRWCFLGSVDDWISLDSSTNLEDLVKRYVCHLGQESFYELMPYS